mgnify:FL=1
MSLQDGSRIGVDPKAVLTDGGRLEHIRASQYVLHLEGKAIGLTIQAQDRKHLKITSGHRSERVLVSDHRDQLLSEWGQDSGSDAASQALSSPMPGLVLSIAVKAGDLVEKGSPLLVLEAMKMENEIKAESEGIVASVSVNAGEAVLKGQVLIEFE